MLSVRCPFGLTSLLTTEIKRLGIKPHNSSTSGCAVNTTSREDIAKINLHSRIASTVYLQIAKQQVTTFDQLFDLVGTIDRSQYIKQGNGFRVLAKSNESTLHATRTIQSITHKSIATKLTGSRDAHREQTTDHQIDVWVKISQDTAKILVDTSGESLHRRGWRRAQGKAAIKENLAAAVVLLAGWPFEQPLRDPCCGSGTLVIEAARFARNIAPGIDRSFACEQFPAFPNDLMKQLKQQARTNQFDKSRTIIGSDIDPQVIKKAQGNAQTAGVDDIITFTQHDLLSSNLPKNLFSDKPTTLISNPPYGQRLDNKQTRAIHQRLAKLCNQPGRNGAIISGYDDARQVFGLDTWKRKESRQGREKCFIWTPQGK